MRIFFLAITFFVTEYSHSQDTTLVLKLFTSDTIFASNDSKLTLRAILVNTSNKPVALLKYNRFSTSSHPTFYWLFEITNSNNETRITEDGYLNKARIYNKGDYFKLKPKQRYTITFEINFSKLVKCESNKKLPDFKKVNREYGEYTIKLLYIDRYKKHPKYVSELRSNSVKVYYKE